MRPRLFALWPEYRATGFGANLRADLAAGLTVALVALPLAMAIAIASGVRPEAGLISAVVGGFLISFLGGSRVQIGGPAAAFIGIVFGVIAQLGFAQSLMALFLSGLIMFAMGLSRLGSVVRFVPDSVVTGFTTGIGVLIAIAQLNHFFGFAVAKLPAHPFEQIVLFAGTLGQVKPLTTLLGLLAFALMIFWSKAPWAKRIALPGTVMVLVLASLLAPMLESLARLTFGSASQTNIATIGSSFGAFGLPSIDSIHWPWLGIAKFDWLGIVLAALSLALLGAIESLICARIADDFYNQQTASREQHQPNQELLAQGVANMTVSMLGGIAVTGTIARTLANIKSGARSPMAGIFHALILLLILLLASPLAQKIPMTVLAAILLWVAWSMIDFKSLTSGRFVERFSMATTIAVTVLWNLLMGVLLGCAVYWLVQRFYRQK